MRGGFAMIAHDWVDVASPPLIRPSATFPPQGEGL